MESDNFRVDSDVDEYNGDMPEDLVRSSKNCLKRYAETKGLNLHSISQMPPDQLADYLKDFYTTIKPPVDESSPTLKWIRQGLHLYFQKSYDIDILADEAFAHANAVFDITLKQAPRRTCHRLRIEFDILKRIYMGPAMGLDHPEKLQNKVFFDVNLYICNKGKEFLRVMTKDDFVVSTDNDGRRFVCLKFHPKFNMRLREGPGPETEVYSEGDETFLGQRMYERPGRVKIIFFTSHTCIFNQT